MGVNGDFTNKSFPLKKIAVSFWINTDLGIDPNLIPCTVNKKMEFIYLWFTHFSPFQKEISPPSKAWVIGRVGNFHHPLFISQSQGGLQKVWGKLVCMFVEWLLPPWCRRVGKCMRVRNSAGFGWWGNSLWNGLWLITLNSALTVWGIKFGSIHK